jgi:hypothetical protein
LKNVITISFADPRSSAESLAILMRPKANRKLG